MGKLINVGTRFDPFYVDINYIVSIFQTTRQYRDVDTGFFKEMVCYEIKTVNGSCYTIGQSAGLKIIKAKGLISDDG